MGPCSPPFGLYTHIQANRHRSAALLAGLFFFVLLVTFALSLLGRVLTGVPGEGAATTGEYLFAAGLDFLWWAPIVSFGTALWIIASFRFHQSVINLVTGSKGVSRSDDPELYHQLETLCIARGLTAPRLRIMESPAVNAFATGVNEEQYAITFTRGLLDSLDKAEVEAVLAHEITHIRNGDVRMLVVAVIVVGIISFVAEMVFRGLRHLRRPSGFKLRLKIGGGKRKGGGGAALIVIAIALLLLALAWFLSHVIRFALMRSREFLADAGAVELTKNPDAMISALTKIAGRGELEGVSSGIMEMCVDNPRSGFADLFATHPSIEERIEALVRYAGGRRPATDASAPVDAGSAHASPIAPAA